MDALNQWGRQSGWESDIHPVPDWGRPKAASVGGSQARPSSVPKTVYLSPDRSSSARVARTQLQSASYEAWLTEDMLKSATRQAGIAVRVK